MYQARFNKRFLLLLSIPLGIYFLIIVSLLISVFTTITWEAVRAAFSETDVLHAIKLSLLTSITSTLLSLAVAISAGYVLSRVHFPGAFLVDTLIDIPIVLPPLVMGLCVLIFFNTTIGRFIDRRILEFIYTWRGAVLVQFVVGCAFAVRVVKAGFDSMDQRFEDVAATLGANPWNTFRRVTLPLARNSLVAGAVISWARIFGLFGPILLVCGTMRRRTEIMPTTIFLETSIGRIEVALVIGACMIVFSIATLVIFKRFGGKGYLW